MRNITSIVKSIRDIMRKDAGLDGDAQRISQLVWMLFMKIFSDKENEWQKTIDDYISPIPSELKWENWVVKNKLSGDELILFINDKLFPTLKEIEGESKRFEIVRSVFEDTFNFMKNGNLFRQVVDEINTINFSGDKHTFNEIYETILKELQNAGSSGEFYTPRAVTQFIVDMIQPKLGETILDPACGTGGFLTCSIDYIVKKDITNDESAILNKAIRGVEKKSLPHLLCTTNLMLHGLDEPSVVRGNMLNKPYDSWKNDTLVDIVLSNPPFGGIEEEEVDKNFPKDFQTKETADLFLALIIKILKKKGRAGVVLPDGILFGNGVKTRIKEQLLETCNLHTIIRLPGGVFNPYTAIKTNILFFEKGKKTKDIWYYEMPLPEGIKSFNRSRPIEINHFDDIKTWWVNRKENEYAWKISMKEIQQRNFDLDIKNPSTQESTSTYSSKELIELIEESFSRSQKLIEELKASLL
ncbi:N-6 DNA methylase [Paludibacter sp.]|uniref:class I SAM-dependent DNA methyltransferase n=1 Tax=Paludibacter sp. TaxID=1898105 RepID=UPI0013527BE5|nr:N-6 DNA methylase [Paludibacter sp.]MTK53755.1 N-6 DNA methylase [Paludibacter sp.]